MLRKFLLRTVECQKANEKGDTFLLNVNGSFVFYREAMAQGDVAHLKENPTGRDSTAHIVVTDGPIRIVGYERDDASADDFIGEVTIPDNEIGLIGHGARLPAEGQSDYNGIYYITYNVTDPDA